MCQILHIYQAAQVRQHIMLQLQFCECNHATQSLNVADGVVAQIQII